MIDDDQDDDISINLILFQKLWWAFMVDFTNVPLGDLINKFEQWANGKSREELNEILSDPDEDDIEEITKRNLEEEGPLYSKEDILRSIWNDKE